VNNKTHKANIRANIAKFHPMEQSTESKYMKDASQIRAERLHAKTLHCSYNYCGICGHVPKTNDEPNYAPLRWWDPDDGWKIGTLCHWCHDEVVNDLPKP